MSILLILALAFMVALKYGYFGNRWRLIIGRAVRTGFLVGGICFVLGFVVPMIAAPGANQGPLLGIFITGPLGFVLGVAWGATREWLRQRNTA